MIGFGENPPQLDELLKQSRQAKAEDIALAEAMERLLKNPDFIRYLQFVVGHRIESWGQQLLEPSGGLDGAFRSEFVKGAMYAFCLCRDLPAIIMQSMSDVRSTQETL